MGELTIDQSPAAAAANGMFAGVVCALPLNGPAGLSAKSELPGDLAAEPVLALGGDAAKPNVAKRRPAEPRAKASKTRGLKMPD